MTDRRVVAHITETSSQPAPGNEASSLRSEVLSRAGAGSAMPGLSARAASAPWPPRPPVMQMWARSEPRSTGSIAPAMWFATASDTASGVG